MEIKFIIVHCSATPEGRDVGMTEIDRWHRQRGFARIGYHYVIRLDGTIERGRPEDCVGAHCLGKNGCSIGVCYIGGVSRDGHTPKDTRTPAQRTALKQLLSDLKRRYPRAKICGHRDFAAKECPSFDATTEFRALGLTAAAASVSLSSCSSHRDTAVNETVDIVAGRRIDIDFEKLINKTDSLDLKFYYPIMTKDTTIKLTADSVVVRRLSKTQRNEHFEAQRDDTTLVKTVEVTKEKVNNDALNTTPTKAIGILVCVLVICIIIKKWNRR